MKTLIVVFLLCMSSVFAIPRPKDDQRGYIHHTVDKYYVHLGNNQWIEESRIYRDREGMNVAESTIIRSRLRDSDEFYASYKKKWKCPYCYMYWEEGQSCQNDDCPSKY